MGEKGGKTEGGKIGGGEKGGNTSASSSKDQRTVTGEGGRDNPERKSISQIPQESLVIPENVPITILTGESENSNSPETTQKRKYKKREKKANSNSNSNSQIGKEEIAALISGTFSLISMKAGEHWALTEQEADSVATPLSNILKKMNLVEQVANVSDGMLLILAVATITIPRVMISSEIKKSKKLTRLDKIKKEGELKVEQESASPKITSREDNSISMPREANDWQFDKTIYATSPQ